MFEKIGAAWKVLRAGEELADAEKWKRHQVTGGMVTAFLAAIFVALRSYGVDLPISDNDLGHVGLAIVALYGAFNSYLTVATSARIGVKGPPDAALRRADGSDQTGE